MTRVGFLRALSAIGTLLVVAAAAATAGAPAALRPAPCRAATSASGSPCPIQVQIHVTQADMANRAASETPATVGCTQGSILVGGGILQDKLDGTQPINGLRIHGSLPAAGNGKPAANGSRDPGSWKALGGFGGQSEPGDQVRAFAMCVTAGPEAFSDTVIVTKTVQGPTGAATTKSVTVSCPSGTRLVGGGTATSPASEPSLKPIGSFPSTSGGAPLAGGSTNPRSWTAVGAAGGMQFGAGHPSTTVYAICSKGLTSTVRVARADLADHPAGPGNLNPGSDPFAVVTAACPRATVLLGGGVLTDGDKPGFDSGVPQQGVHVRGSFPSTAKGLPLGEGAKPAGAWTVIVQAGGQPTPGTDTHAFALCAR